MIAPMWDPQPISWFGLDASTLVFVAAVCLSLVGFAWLRRTLPVEEETHNFLATAPRPRNVPLMAGLVLAAVALALALVASW
jgi:hypothetical protein